MTTALDRELKADVGTDSAFQKMIGRLSKLSVDRHFDAYVDVAWDDPEMQVDPADPRWKPMVSDPVAKTEWYASLSPEDRSRYCLYRVAAAMKIGWHFENLLQRGLLTWAFDLPNGAPEFRYVHHEVIEESQHTLMFQELVNRSGLPVVGMPWWARFGARLVVFPAARWAPCTFFFMVLGGEDPIDHVQRRDMAESDQHPLAARIMRIHITEEARHISFARSYLRHNVPRLPAWRRGAISIVVPVLLAAMTRLMLEPPPDLRKHTGLPLRVAFKAMNGPDGMALFAESARKIRELCEELGLMSRPARAVWKAVGLVPGRRSAEPVEPADPS
jgi:P-aminobenzoate N-oxygenase AurF